MNKTPRLSNTDIEYLDKVWNFASGCGKGCSYCYAEKITRRFTNYYPNGFEPTIYPEALISPLHLKKPSRIGVCYMGDLFWDCPEFVPDKVIDGWRAEGFGVLGTATLKETIQAVMARCPQHTFVFLTKQPQNLQKFSPFPDNAWVGVSATDTDSFMKAGQSFDDMDNKMHFVSFEPLLDWNFELGCMGLHDFMIDAGIKWVIIGSLTGTYQKLIEDAHKYPDLTLTKSKGIKWTLQPKIEWVQEIVEACDKADIPVFLKDNLKPLLLSHVKDYPMLFKSERLDSWGEWGLRQEMFLRI